MRRIHIIGRRNCGKTTLTEDLLRELTGRGLRVGTFKHSGHDHELDRPGKDSYRHRQAGASPVAVVTPTWAALHLCLRQGEDIYARLAPLYAGCAVVLVEGDTAGGSRDRQPLVEVWRAGCGAAPLAGSQDLTVVALVTDDPVEGQVHPGVQVWPRADLAGLASRLLDHLGIDPLPGSSKKETGRGA